MVEEALNLAYHGARAEKPGFNVTIVKSLDPNAGAADLYPQEMTRVLLNLISNGFYATTKRKQAEANGAYEPTLTASTRDLGDSVEIAIRDNGTGHSRRGEGEDVQSVLHHQAGRAKAPGSACRSATTSSSSSMAGRSRSRPSRARSREFTIIAAATREPERL